MRILSLAAALLVAAGGDPAPELHVFNWADYFAADTISGFEKEFRCKVTLDYIESSETLRAKLQGGRSGYDVVFPSDEVMPGFIAAGLLEKIDAAKVPNLKNLAARFRGLPYDPRNEYSIPYMWGTTGIAYNKKHVSPPPDSWAALWDPKYAGRATLLDDAREAFAAALWLEGGDPERPTAEGIEKAKQRLIRGRPLAYDSSPKQRLIRGEAWISQCFNGDALQAAEAEERSADVGYVIPKEGGTQWVDNMAIAKGAPNPDLAHAFLDYLLRPDVSAAISNEVFFANPNEAAWKHIKKEVLENRFANPSEEDLKRCSLLGDLSPELKKKLDDAWAEVKASGGSGGISFLLVGAAAVAVILVVLVALVKK
jgi:spermidine/putrescine-binding protein